jgi:UPF0755 protein
MEDDGTVYAEVEIRNGESAMSVGRRLENAGLIKTRYFWNLLARLDDGRIKAGVYRFKKPVSQFQIRSILVEGRQEPRRVTIPEGLTLSKTAALLEEGEICDAKDFLAAVRDPDIIGKYPVSGPTMEGYLYPDTYFFPVPYPADKVIDTMANTFFERLKEIASESIGMDPRELNRKVILASIVEREYRVPEEAPLMAGVFYNRLEIGMKLQSCATVEYVITEIQGRPHPTVLYDRDTEIQNPFNTYVMPGLPPGPIASPGAVALNAAFHPQASNYLYFRLADSALGKHYFSKTFDEHIRAASLYVKGSAVN